MNREEELDPDAIWPELREEDPVLARTTLKEIIDALARLSTTERSRVLRTVSTYYGHQEATEPIEQPPRSTELRPGVRREPQFTGKRELSPKEFLLEKAPHTQVDRVACLAYYLTHYEDIESFKTAEISKVNTEAAQPKFANAAQAVRDAIRRGLIVGAAKKGTRQISALGEQYVDALPDRAAANATLATQKPRGTKRKTSKKKSTRAREKSE